MADKKEKLFFKKIKMFDLDFKYRVALYATTIISCTLAIVSLVTSFLLKEFTYIIYGVAFCTLILSIFYIVRYCKITFNKISTYILSKSSLLNFLASHYHLRTFLSSIPSSVINLVFALFNAFLGIRTGSAWYISLAIYYMFLCLMRFYLLFNQFFYGQTKDNIKPWMTLLRCGIMLSCMSIALVGMVILMVDKGYGKSYNENIIAFIAIYTFYKVISSITSVVKARKMKSPFLMGIKNISYADAMVSLLSLQTAMFAVYGQSNQQLSNTMNTITGSCVCIFVIMMGVWMILLSHKQIKQL